MKNNTTATTTSASTASTTEMPIQTKHLASRFKIKATALRRVLRSMPDYADGIHTNYRWSENDPRIAKIELQLKKLEQEKADRAKAAKTALDERAKKLAATAAADAKL